MKCIVVSEHPEVRNQMENFLRTYPNTQWQQTFESSQQALQFLEKNETEVVFLDLPMPQSLQLQNHKTAPLFVLITESMEYAIPSFNKNVVSCLLKPLAFNEFEKAIIKSKELLALLRSGQDKESILIKVNGIYKRVLVNDIDFVEGMSNYLALHCDRTRYIIYQTIKSMEETLRTMSFARIHKSYLVNMSKITSFNSTSVKIGEKDLPLGRSFKEDFRHRWSRDGMNPA
jgi:DNA-binding LytR/AlgR family response regulator